MEITPQPAEPSNGSFLRRIVSALSAGFVLCYFSEYMFWASFTHYPTDGAILLREIIQVWLVYSLAAYIVLWAASAFKVNDFYSWFFVGAIYGWLTEGSVVYTMYDQFPLQISWTGLAWHSLISVVWGWYAFRKAIHEGNTKKILKYILGFGCFFGFWAPTWWSEAGVILPIEDFASYIVFFTIPACIFFMLYEKVAPAEFNPSKIEKILFCGVFLFLFIFGTIPTVLYYAITLPILLGIVIWVLKHYRANLHIEKPAVIDLLQTPVPVARYLWFLFVPIIAIGIVLIFTIFGWIIQTSIFVYLVTMPSGFIIFGMGIKKIVSKKVSKIE